MEPLDRYEFKLAEARRQFAVAPAVTCVLSNALSAPRLEAFLIAYHAVGVQMTEHLESWCRRAGQRCIELGYEGLGTALLAESRHQVTHHALAQDLQALVGQRNERVRTGHSADSLLALRPTPGVRRYVDLHEYTIQSVRPFAELAIAYEIERLSRAFGHPLVELCAGTLGPITFRSLSFLGELLDVRRDAAVPQAHTLAGFLAEFPNEEEAMVHAGLESIDAYHAIMADCLLLAEMMVGSEAQGLNQHRPLER
jgi:hypothetical protein